MVIPRGASPGRGPQRPGGRPGMRPGGRPLGRGAPARPAAPPPEEAPERVPVTPEDAERVPELPAGRDLDALAARHIVGLHRLRVFAHFEGAQSDVYRLHSEAGKSFFLPEYSRKIEDAWTLVEALPECSFLLRTAGGGETAVEVATVERGRAGKRIASAGGETAPLALARAAVLAAAALGGR